MRRQLHQRPWLRPGRVHVLALAAGGERHGHITTRDARSVTVNMSWDGTGALEATSNTTTFWGFTGHFEGKRRDAIASGTVVLDG